jgi:SAM-dependent methyltransferase
MELWNFYRTDNEVRKSRKRTEEWTIPAIKRFYDGGTVRMLSVGCGSAVDVAVLREHGYFCWGTDPDENCCTDARKFFVQSDACSLPFDSEDFDLTMCMEAFEHIGAPNTNREWKPCPEYRVNRKRAAEELLRVTKPGGVIIVVTPNRLFPIDEHGAGKTGLRWHLPFQDQTLSSFCLNAIEWESCRTRGTTSSRNLSGWVAGPWFAWSSLCCPSSQIVFYMSLGRTCSSIFGSSKTVQALGQAVT